MTKAEWLACSDPMPMISFLQGKASDRKMRLYFCGGCRQIAHVFYGPQSLAAVEVAERFADGQASEEELERAEWRAEVPTFGYDLGIASYASPTKTAVIPRLVAMGALPESALSGGEWPVEDAVRERLLAAAELAEFCAVRSLTKSDWGDKYISRVDWPGRWLFTCVFGNTFRPVLVDTAWLAWGDGTVVKLAQRIYDERSFDRLPVLADALEDAGCGDADILAHCRGTGPHVRGCWVVDLLLGRK